RSCLGRRRADENHAIGGDANLRDRGEGKVDHLERSRRGVQRGEVITTGFAITTNTPFFRYKAVEAGAKNPLGLAKLRFHRAERLDLVFSPPVEIPPPSSGGDKGENAGPRPR